MVKHRKTKKRIYKKRKSYKKQKGGNKDYNIIFTNEYQNGDIYISSQFIIDIKKKTNKDIKYYIKLSGNNSINPENFTYMNIPLLDINTNTQYKKGDFITKNDETKEIIINTWCGVFKNFNILQDVYLPLYYEQFKELYKLLEINMEPIEFYIPSFNQPSFITYNDNLEVITNIYNKIKKKKVLLCNGNGFSYGSSIDPKIIKFFIDNNYFVKVTNENAITDSVILEEYKKNLDEFSSNNDIMKKDNLLYVNNIFASQSDIIVGIASGLFITTYSKETLDKQFIMISNDNHIVYEKFNSSWIKNDNVDAIIANIELLI